MTSYEVFEVKPAGLWIVDADGRAVRPAWPAAPCGYQAGPLFRADSSGGARIDIELGGCRRVTGTGIPYVAVSAAVTAVVDEAPR